MIIVRSLGCLTVAVLSLSLGACGFHVGNDGLYDDPEGLNTTATAWQQLPEALKKNFIFFPVTGPHHFQDDWGAARAGHRHIGIDIMAAKMTPIIAVVAGTVAWVRDQKGGECCYLAIDHKNDFQTRYIHLNNDTPGTDDGQVVGISPGLRAGQTVRAGEIIGWVGDSGNAEATAPHLHFEVWYQKRPMNPYKFLVNAKHVSPLTK